jgi:hypothetical protein
MENKTTTKTPIPTTSGFLNFAFCTLIFAFSTYLSCHEFIATEPPFLSMDYFSVFSAFSVAVSFVPLCLGGQDPRSTLVEPPLQIALFYAKQTQFLQRQNQHNLFSPKGLHQYSAPPRPKKQSQSNPISK